MGSSERTLDPAVVDRLRRHLDRLYPAEAAAAAHERLIRLLEAFELPRDRRPAGRLFDEREVLLITYADQVREMGRPPLESLRVVLNAHVAGLVSGVHLLPHYPSTSDDGFAVVDYLAVDPLVGDWAHVEQLARTFRLMLDAVLNHSSASCPWFRGWLEADPPDPDVYIAEDPEADWSMVTRPRTSSLLTPFEAVEGTRWVWTTFSPDQVDLNYRTPEVLLRVCDVLLSYVAHGAGLLRLDAIAFLWKEAGTPCVHLPETHEIIKLWRTMLDAVAPGTLLVTETNVPHTENISYFGDATDEAHLVYQFPLAPLVLSTFRRGDATELRDWLAGLEPLAHGTAFLNFLGSHDGIGLRPAEDLLPPEEIAAMCADVEAHGGGVSYRTLPDGSTAPYELNTVYFDALNPPRGEEPEQRQIDRFMSAQSILLALSGVPAIYFHALFGSRNWSDGLQVTGRLRTINRQKLARPDLEHELADPTSLRSRVLGRFREQIALRIAEPAFHPDAPQDVLGAEPGVLALKRRRLDGSATLLCVHDVAGSPRGVRLEGGEDLAGRRLVDLCDGSSWDVADDGGLTVDVPAYGVRWLRSEG